MEWTTGGHMGLMAVWWIIIFAALAAVVWFVVAAGRRGSAIVSIYRSH